MSRRLGARAASAVFALLALAAPGCMLLDPPSDVRADSEILRPGMAGSGNSPAGANAASAGALSTRSGGASNGGSGTAGAAHGGSGTVGAAHGGSGTASGGTAGTGHGGSAGRGGTGGSQPTAGSAGGIPLTPMDGWIAGTSNTLQIQGAIFAYSDEISTPDTTNLTGTNACIKGIAAKVDLNSEVCTSKMFVPPVTDCFGQFWGAALGMNLNQPLDPVGALGMPYNASALKGFAFEITGNMVPTPSALRFKVENATTEFCSVPTAQVRPGTNAILFTDLVAECYKVPVPTAPLATSAQSELIKISWQVVTNTNSTVPYDFCVSNIRALLK